MEARNPIFPSRNTWEFSVFAGLSSQGDGSFITPIEGGGTKNVSLDSDTGSLFGLRITENLGEHFGAELEYALTDQPSQFTGLQSSISRLDMKQKIHKIAYSMLVYPLKQDQKVRPYGSLGVGASSFQVSADPEAEALQQGIDLKDRWKLAFSYGTGVKIQIRQPWGIRFDLRDHVTSVPNFGLPEQANPVHCLALGCEAGAGFRPDGTFHNWQISVGLMYTFDTR